MCTSVVSELLHVNASIRLDIAADERVDLPMSVVEDIHMNSCRDGNRIVKLVPREEGFGRPAGGGVSVSFVLLSGVSAGFLVFVDLVYGKPCVAGIARPRSSAVPVSGACHGSSGSELGACEALPGLRVAIGFIQTLGLLPARLANFFRMGDSTV